MSVVMGDALVQGNVVLGHTTASAPAAATYPVAYYKLNDNVFNEDVDNHSSYGGSSAHSSSYGMTVQDSSDAGNNLDAKIIRETSDAQCDPISPENGWPYGNTRAEFTTATYKTAPASLYFHQNQGTVNIGTSSLLDPGTTDAFSVSIWIYPSGSGNGPWSNRYLWHRFSAYHDWDSGSCTGDYWEGLDTNNDGANNNEYRGFYLNYDGSSPAKILVELACDGDDLSGAAMRAIRRTDAVVERDEWNHIVMTYSSASLHVYVNGSSVGGDETSTSGWDYASTTMPAAVRTNADWPTQIGGYSLPKRAGNVAGGQDKAYIQEASYWDIKLSATQVATLYGSGTPPDLDGGI